MKLKIIIFDKIRNKEIQSLINYYLKLSGKYFNIELKCVKGPRDRKLKAVDLEKILDADFNILLREQGDEFNTAQLAGKFENYKINYKSVNLIIGNAYGFEDEVNQKAGLILSLGKITTSHELALLILAEQIYRIGNLNAGGGYHNE